MGGLAGGASSSGPAFNGVFLAYLLVCGALSVFFLLYFNRVFASVISLALRTWTWHQYRIHIDIQALQVSLLGGRIFFTGLRYHGNNETILVQNGHITWSYWLRRVREVDLVAPEGKDKAAGGDAAGSPARAKKSARLPCRIKVSLLGLEWFIYNRSAAYDSLLGGLTQDTPPAKPGETVYEQEAHAQHKLRKRFDESDGKTQVRPLANGITSALDATANEKVSKVSSDRSRSAPKARDARLASSEGGDEDEDVEGRRAHAAEDGIPLMLQLFPIHIQCDKAAVVMGNENTKAILIVKTKSLSGEIDASATETPDPYRQIFNLKFERPVVEMKENEDYKEDQAERATRERQAAQATEPPPKKSFFRRHRRKVLGTLRGMVPCWWRSVESLSIDGSRNRMGTAGTQVPGSVHWQGLSRYLDDDDQDEKALWSSHEYAAVPTILDSPEATVTVYWDVPGRVAPQWSSDPEKPAEQSANINGHEPPAWGISVTIKGGSVNYGPWADRQRAVLQRMFFPTLCKDATPAEHLPVGAYRLPTQFRLYVEIEEDVTVRVPVRENSKNWRYKGKEPVSKIGRAPEKRRTRAGLFRKADQGAAPAHQRPYGWLDVKVAANATIVYSMDMTANSLGYSNTLNLDLPKTEISSSVNHELLWRSGSQQISCDLSTPLRWNGLRQWHFDVVSNDLELFLLRDHVFLLTDLVDDWASGPPAEYMTFTPFKYFLDLHFHNLKLYLNVNDGNIIDNPTDLEDNTFVVIATPQLDSSTCLPFDKFRPPTNAISFDARTETVSVGLNLPSWNTQATFVDSKDVGQVEGLVVEGKYHYKATTSPANTDTLVLNLSAQSPAAFLYGFVIRYFLKLKDNYLGDDVHFRTLEEHQDSLRLKKTNPEAEQAQRPPPKKSNDLDVMFGVRIDDPKIFLPANIYSAGRHVQLDVACLTADLRFTNYYMDLDLALSPISLSLGNLSDGVGTPMSAATSTQLFIDGITVYGSRLFGLPPAEPTYLCNWDFSVGAVTGECTPDFLTALMGGAKAFAFTFDDNENALVPYSSIIVYDVTFLRASVQSVRLWLHVEDAAFLLSCGSIDVKYNDWARSHYSKRANIRIPDLELSCVNSESAARHKSRPQYPVETDAFLKTEIRLAIVGRKFNFKEERRLQQELVRRHDQRTHRAPFLQLEGVLDEFVPDPVDPVAQPVPPIPLPATAEDVFDTASLSSAGTSMRSRSLRHKSSFLSVSSSSARSIVKRGSRTSSLKSRYPEQLLLPVAPVIYPGHVNRSPGPGRDVSGSTGRHSAFYSATGDYGERRDPLHTTLAFSSQYFAPYFPLESIRPDTANVNFQSVEEEEPDRAEEPSFSLEDVDPDILSEEFVCSSTIVEIPTGLTAFFNQNAVKHAAALIAALQPLEPEDVLDSVQTSAMSDIFGMQRQQKMKGHIKDLVVRLPEGHIRFMNTSGLDSADPPKDEQDQYDLSIKNMALSARFQTKWEDAFDLDTRKSRDSFHLRMGKLELSASERLHQTGDPQAAVMVRVDDVLASMGSKDVSYLDVDIGAITASTSSEKVEYLASLVHRTSTLGTELGSLFAETASREDRLLKYLTYYLVIGRQATPDPSFLVRPSAVLRSANEHLRTFDSWKLAVRLRQMWSKLSESDKDKLRLECFAGSKSAPGDARQKIVEAFSRWRSWDLDYISDSVLLNNIFGRIKHAPDATTQDLPLLGVFRIREAQLCLDPGPKQNEIWFRDLTTRLQIKDLPAQGAEGTNMDGPAKPTTLVNICCSDVAFNLNWELCELADDILKLYQSMASDSKPRDGKPEPKEMSQTRQKRVIHLVLALGQGAITVDTINLNCRTLSNGLKVSLLLRQDAASLTATDFVLNCDAVSSRVRSHSQALTEFQLRGPSVILSHELLRSDDADSHTIKATASTQELSLSVKQDPLVLIEVLDLLIRDEAAQLYRLKQHLPSSPGPGSRPKPIVERLSNIKLNIAMFLNEYSISLPLLRSLTYHISGVVARVATAATFGKEIIVDFDVKENSHEMQIDVNNRPRSISLLQIPPTNGRVTVLVGKGEQLVSVFASLELVQLDASAVYSLLTALNRPEISSAVDDLQQQIKITQGHVTEIFGDEKSCAFAKPDPQTDTKVAYSIHLTFAGLKVYGNSPLQSEDDLMAHISFLVDSVHLEVANRVQNQGPILANPEVHINLRQISFGVHRGTTEKMSSCGSLSFGALITATTRLADDGSEKRYFDVKSDGFLVSLSPETVSTAVDVLGYMGDKMKDIDTSRELEYLRKLRQTKPRIAVNDREEEEEADIFDSFLSSITYSFEMRAIQVTWLVNLENEPDAVGKADLVFSLERIEFATKTKNSARLTIENLQGQMVGPSQDKRIRSPNSALLPEIIFNIAYVSTSNTRRLAFQAVGKSLDLRLNSGFIIPAANLNDSIGLSVKNARQASQKWNTTIPAPQTCAEKQEEHRQRSILGSKRLESLLVDADFAGAMVHLTGKRPAEESISSTRPGRSGTIGKYGQFNPDGSGSGAVLRSPGLAWKLQYGDNGKEDPTLYAEIKIDASSNILYPSVVPLVMDMTSSIKEVVRKDDNKRSVQPQELVAKAKPAQGENILTADPSAVLGRMRLNLGLRICRQEFSLSCQPIARVAATTSFEDVYFTVNTVRSLDHGNFFAVSGAFSQLQASVQHVYSRESTGSFAVDSIVVSLMNSKHVSGTSGVSAILKVSPMKVSVNAKQLQDFLLFREIWIPHEIRQGSAAPVAQLNTETSQGHLVQRYQQVAATAAFPWTATISINALEIGVDLGQSIGRSVFVIENFWVSSKKTSDWEQNLCLGFRQIGVESTGRMSGFVTLEDFKLRTSIQWPKREQALNETPIIQASIGFSQLRVKAAFDYQAFLIADITSLQFLMYNVRRSRDGSGDRLVAVFDGDAVQVFGTTTSAAQGVALFQAFQKLVQERRASFEASLKEIERFLRRSSIPMPPVVERLSLDKSRDELLAKSPISLDTDVVVTLKAVNLGVFPSTFSDHQVFKMEALNAQARFVASIENGRIHSILGLTLGQLRIGLAGVRNIEAPKTLSELAVEDVIRSATGSRGGTILKVPRVEATMQTWQSPDSRKIDYIFKSAFEGKVEVGWNYSRISYIRGMWANHSKALAQTYGRELPLTAIKVTGVPEPEGEGQGERKDSAGEQTKITAEVHVPQSRYEYYAVQPPIIETPQLRDMGEATPPLEWIGLHRERLPNLTHQIVIVSLLELAGEVEDAYSRILGSS